MKKAIKNKDKQLRVIKKAYNKTVDNYKKGIKDIDVLPEIFINSLEFRNFQKKNYNCNSGQSDIKRFLAPKKGMKFLDIGSCANLINYKLYNWPSTYVGVDISEKLIKAMKAFVSKNNIKIGGLYVADVSEMPFDDNVFDIAACIGVLEYFDFGYITRALRGLYRVLKSTGKLVLDMPNLAHPDTETMIKLESYLGRVRGDIPKRDQFEKVLKKLFLIKNIKDDSLMIKYCLECGR